MLRILHDTKYDFVRWWRWALGSTLAFLLVGLAAYAVSGPPPYSVEFTGGTLMQVQFREPPNVESIRTALDRAGIRGAEIQQFGTAREYAIRAHDPEQVSQQAAGAEVFTKRIEDAVRSAVGEGNFTVQRTEAVGPRVGAELRRGAIIAILVSFGLTLVYLAIRFEWRFGVAAVLATAHDILGTLAFLKLLNLEVSLTVIAGILTVIGYSLNDTIIIFDRIRENLRRKRKETLAETVNRSINETLPRSVLTHATTLAATLALLLFAGEVLRPFAWIMTFGIFTGTFSSIYVAGPVLLWIERKWPRSAGDRGGAGPRPAARRPASAAARAKEPAGTA
jgi:preprotein translocase subunit SecF